jgi:hypothetical protein
MDRRSYFPRFCDAAPQVLDGVTVKDTVSAAQNGTALVSYALDQFQAPNETRWSYNFTGGGRR